MVNQTNLLQPHIPTQPIQAQVGGVVRQHVPYQPVVSAYAAQPVLDPRVMLQPGFSNTNVEQVRLSNQQSQAQAFVSQQQPILQHVPQVIGQPVLQTTQAFAPQSPSVMLQPGYAGTNPEQVMQNNQISQAHVGGYLGPQAFVPQQQSPAVMFQPGYAGTGIGQLQWAQAGGYGTQAIAQQIPHIQQPIYQPLVR